MIFIRILNLWFSLVGSALENLKSFGKHVSHKDVDKDEIVVIDNLTD